MMSGTIQGAEVIRMRAQTMRGSLYIALFIAAVTFAPIALAQHSLDAPTAESKTAEQAYKNITQLKGTPAEQLMSAMQVISSSLGVECSVLPRGR